MTATEFSLLCSVLRARDCGFDATARAMEEILRAMRVEQVTDDKQLTRPYANVS